MNYNEYIENILKIRPNIKQKGVYMERHHIVPKCMGGSNKECNLIWLTPSEHYIAHKMLYKENENNPKLYMALWNMCNCSKGNRYITTPEEYEEVRNQYNKNISGKKHPLYGTHRIGYFKGKHLSEEAKEKLRIKALERFKDKRNHPCFGKKKTDEFKKNMSKIKKGKFTGSLSKNAIKVVCIETGRVFDCMLYAANSCGKNHGGEIGVSCRTGKIRYGFHWKYYGE